MAELVKMMFIEENKQHQQPMMVASSEEDGGMLGLVSWPLKKLSSKLHTEFFNKTYLLRGN